VTKNLVNMGILLARNHNPYLKSIQICVVIKVIIIPVTNESVTQVPKKFFRWISIFSENL